MKNITPQELAEELVETFGTWIGTPSEELLEDGGTVIDHLTDSGRKYDRDELNAVPPEVWGAAWDQFYKMVQE